MPKKPSNIAMIEYLPMVFKVLGSVIG